MLASPAKQVLVVVTVQLGLRVIRLVRLRVRLGFDRKCRGVILGGLPCMTFPPYHQGRSGPFDESIVWCFAPVRSNTICRGGYGMSMSMFGPSTAVLSHDHRTQYKFVFQSLRLWSQAMRNMYR